MPAAVHKLAKKLKGKKGVDNPFALANAIVKKQGGKAYSKRKMKHMKSKGGY